MCATEQQVPAGHLSSGLVSQAAISCDLCPKFPPALRGVLEVKSLALGRHLVHCLSL